MRLSTIVLLALLGSACATFKAAPCTAHACYKEAPCTGDWIGLTEGGCALFVVNVECPEGSTPVEPVPEEGEDPHE